MADQSAERTEDGPAAHPRARLRSWTLSALAGIYLRGLCMGTADAIPGVSGGTIALITGIYERLIAAVTAVTPRRLRSVLAGIQPSARERAYRALVEMDVVFLVTLVAGIGTAILAVTSAVEVAVEHYPVPTFGFFLGLIAASAVVIATDVALDTPEQIAAGAAGFVLAFVVSGRAATGLGHDLPLIFLAGAIAVSAMILPGISGSLLLLLIGQYTYLTGTVATLRETVVGVVTGGDPSALVAPATVAIVFVSGALVGLFTVAHAVRWALDHHRQATLAFLVALVAGALRAPLIQIQLALTETGRTWSGEIAVVAGTALLGAVIVVALERYAGGIEL